MGNTPTPPSSGSKPIDRINVQSPNGQLFNIPRTQYDEAVKRGFKAYNPAISKVAVPDANPGMFSRGLSFINRPILSEKIASAFTDPGGAAQKIAEHEIVAGHPVRAAIAEFDAGTKQSIAKLFSGFTSPVSIGAMALSMGESIPVKLAQTGLGLTFGASSAAQAIIPRQTSETSADAAERRLMGAGTAMLATSGEMAQISNSVRNVVRSKLGLGPDLAAKVGRYAAEAGAARASGEAAERTASSEGTQEAGKIQMALEDDLQSLEGQTSTRISNIERRVQQESSQLTGKVTDLKQRQLLTGTQIVADTVRVAHQELARVKQPFNEIASDIPGTVAEPTDIRNLIEKSVTDKGAQTSEIPSKVFAAFGKESPEGMENVSRLSNDELKSVNALYRSGLRGKDLRSGLTNLGYVPKQVNAMVASAEGAAETGATGLSFGDLTRIKDDLYEGARAAKDGSVRAGLNDAADRISDIQESIADKHKQGNKYRAAKSEYKTFKRSIGSPLVEDWLSAYDVADQQMGKKVNALTNGTNADALRTVLKAAKIDTGPLDSIISEKSAASRRLKELPQERKNLLSQAASQQTRQSMIERNRAKAAMRDVTGKTREITTAIRSRTHHEVTEAENKGEAIVPGRKASELSGMSNTQVQEARLHAIADAAKKNGMGNPFSMMQIIYGAVRLAMGSTYGAFPLGYGLMREGVPSALRNPKFQDWIMDRADIAPSNVKLRGKIRRGLINLSVELRHSKAIRSQALTPGLAPGSAPDNDSTE